MVVIANATFLPPPPAVQILPMSKLDYNNVSELQEDYFLNRLPFDQCGRYRYKTRGINPPSGTVVLFQFDNHIVASAIYRGRDEDKSFELERLAGYLQFDIESIRVFDRVNNYAMKTAWPKFESFSQVARKDNLDPALFSIFQSKLRGIRRPTIWPGEDIRSTGSPSLPELDRRKSERATVLRQIYECRGQPAFRLALFDRYGSRCMVTGCAVEEVLEAAHIEPYCVNCDNDPSNGLLLRADIHTLFDLDCIGIHPQTLTIEVAPVAQEDYAELQGRSLICPSGQRPSVVKMGPRYEQFRSELSQASSHKITPPSPPVSA